MHVSIAEILGYIAAAFTLTTYSMKTMIPLRMFGITANVFFLSYGYLAAAYPTFVLHCALLPLNSVRLYQMLQLVKHVREAATGDLDMNWLKPFMSARRITRGTMLFRQGDPATEMFFVVSGNFQLVETGIPITPGMIVGELGFLSPTQTRTQSLKCLEDGEILHIAYDQLRQLYFQNPRFGFYFLRLTTRRLFENITKLESELATRNASG